MDSSRLDSPRKTKKDGLQDSVLFDVRETKYCGRGCFAKTQISSGKQILLEKPLAFYTYEASVGSIPDAPAYKPIPNLTSEEARIWFDWMLIESILVDPGLKQKIKDFATVKLHKEPPKIHNVVKYLQHRNFEVRIKVEDVLWARGVIEANAFAMSFSLLMEPIGNAIFLQASGFNHSCDPNAHYIFSQTGEIILFSIRDIEPDEEICVSFLNRSTLLLPFKLRQQYLEILMGFSCRCELCRHQADPNHTSLPLSNVNLKDPLDRFLFKLVTTATGFEVDFLEFLSKTSNDDYQSDFPERLIKYRGTLLFFLRRCLGLYLCYQERFPDSLERYMLAMLSMNDVDCVDKLLIAVYFMIELENQNHPILTDVAKACSTVDESIFKLFRDMELRLIKTKREKLIDALNR